MSTETFAQMKTDVSLMIQKTDSNYATKIGNFINLKYQEWANNYPWTELLDDDTATTVSGQEVLILPKKFDEIMVLSQRTSNHVLVSMSESERQRRYLNTITTPGLEFGFSPVGESGVAIQPTVATVLKVSSSSASDGAANTVRVWGTVNGEDDNELFTLNGTTTVTGTKSFTSIQRVSKSANTVGVITITDTTGLITIATIGRFEDTPRYKRIKLVRVPQAADTIYITGFRRIRDLINDEDVPEIPIATCLKQGAYAYCLQEQRQFQKAQIEMQIADKNVLTVWEKGAMRGDKIEQSIPMWDPGRSQYNQYGIFS